MKSPSVHRLLSILLLLHLGFISSKAQSPCGTDHVHQKHMESDSAYAAEFEKTLRNSIKYRIPGKKTENII
jgi:hypothetical protein